MKLKIPELSLVLLVGASGSGKTSFAAKHFAPFESISSDYCRGLVSNDCNSLNASGDAFTLLCEIVRTRLRRGLLTVVDATNVSKQSRAQFLDLAREFHVLPSAIVFDLPRSVCIERNENRERPGFGPHVVHNQLRDLARGIRGLGKEGFRYVHVFRTEEEVNAAEISREPLWNNRKSEVGPFDIIGDIHGCYDELLALLDKLGYGVGADHEVTPPEGRRLIFLGDLVDRGPRTPDVLRLAMRAVAEGKAICVPGNHDIKLMRALRGEKVQVKHGLEESLAQLASETEEFRQQVVTFIHDLVSHLVLDHGRLVVAHAGMKEAMQGRSSSRVRDFALFGETTGETDEFGLPVRHNWAAEYRGRATVVYGHTAVPQPMVTNRTINIDTGCVFGGHLTSYRYPSGEFVSVPAARVYSEPIRPLAAPAGDELSAQQVDDGLLHIEDVFGRRAIETSLRQRVSIRPENAGPALEALSRFGVDPHWLIYVPPTMSPSETSGRPDYLEHPEEAFDYFIRQEVTEVICEEKHMGSRAVVVLCRDQAVAAQRFGLKGQGIGSVYTRTGRAFFSEPADTERFLGALRDGFDQGGVWELLKSDWVCLDCELMPWSLKAKELLRKQYAPVGAAGEAMLSRAVELLTAATARGVADLTPMLASHHERLDAIRRYRKAYVPYCWTTEGLDGLRLAPFHIMATEEGCHADKSHLWHMETIHEIVSRAAIPLLFPTPWRVVSLADDADRQAAIDWWTELTDEGGEGMVVKPMNFVTHKRGGIVQPAIKCRGREYLRLIYGPEYTLPSYLERLKQRGVGAKRSMALREFALGIEGLERFVRREPLRRVHECALGVLALESEPVDPRL